MTREWAYIIMFCGGALLFAIGGTGFKWVRRYLLPILLGVVALLSHVSILSAIGTCVLSSVAFHLPYGSNSPIWLRGLTAIAFGACLLPFQLSPLCFIPTLAFIALYWLSRKFNWFTWKWTELLTGAIWGITAVLLF